jgi:hypothetical protein
MTGIRNDKAPANEIPLNATGTAAISCAAVPVCGLAEKLCSGFELVGNTGFEPATSTV